MAAKTRVEGALGSERWVVSRHRLVYKQTRVSVPKYLPSCSIVGEKIRKLRVFAWGCKFEELKGERLGGF